MKKNPEIKKIEKKFREVLNVATFTENGFFDDSSNLMLARLEQSRRELVRAEAFAGAIPASVEAEVEVTIETEL